MFLKYNFFLHKLIIHHKKTLPLVYYNNPEIKYFLLFLVFSLFQFYPMKIYNNFDFIIYVCLNFIRQNILFFLFGHIHFPFSEFFYLCYYNKFLYNTHHFPLISIKSFKYLNKCNDQKSQNLFIHPLFTYSPATTTSTTSGCSTTHSLPNITHFVTILS